MLALPLQRQDGYLSPHNVLTVRYWTGGRVWCAYPMHVVDDDERGVSVLHVPGAVGVAPDGYPEDRQRVLRNMAADRRLLRRFVWTDTVQVHVFQEGRWWSPRAVWDASSRAFRCWHVDICTPIAREGPFLDTTDLYLDLLVYPDRNWRWKDEEELRWAVTEAGLVDASTAARIALAREEVVEALERREFPFDAVPTFPELSPELPVMPLNWDAT